MQPAVCGGCNVRHVAGSTWHINGMQHTVWGTWLVAHGTRHVAHGMHVPVCCPLLKAELTPLHALPLGTHRRAHTNNKHAHVVVFRPSFIHTQVLVYTSLLDSLARDEDLVAAALAQEVARVLAQHEVCNWGLVREGGLGGCMHACMHASGSGDPGGRQA